MRKRIYAYIIVLLVIVIVCLDVNQWLNAKEETIVPSVIRYSEDNKEAEILFNIEGVNEEKYELITVIADSDSEIVYDGTQDTSEDIAYTVRENGDYSFTVTYIEKQKEETEEKSIVLIASVTELITTEETYEVIEINDSEEVSENTETKESEQDTIINILSDNETEKSTSSVIFDGINFPDDTFRKYLKDTYSFIENNELTTEQLEKVTSIDLSSTTYNSVSSLIGISYFTELTSLNINGCTNLTTLYVSGTQITSLDVSGCTSLEILYVNGDSNNIMPLTTLTLGNNTALTDLRVQYTNLSSLDVSGCTSLQTLYVHGDSENIMPLTSLKLGSDTALTDLRVQHTNLLSLDVSKCTSLQTLYVCGTQIASLDVSSNTNLKALLAYGTSSSTMPLATLTLGNNTAITNLQVQYTSLSSLDVSNCSSLKTLYAYGTQITELDVSRNTNLQILLAYGVSSSSIPLATLTLGRNTALTDLRVQYTSLSSLDVSDCTSLKTLYVNGDSNNIMSLLTTLTLGDNTALTDLRVQYTNLTELDVTGCTALQTMYTYGTQITSLDVSGNTNLITLYAYGTNSSTMPLATLILGSNTALTDLRVQYTNLSSLDVSKCTALTILYANNTPLSYLDLSDSITISNFNVSPLDTLNINEVNQDEDGNYWVNLKTLFSGISIDRVSSVNVSGSGSYDENTGKITGLTEGTTITYTYYCNSGTIYTIQPTIKMESLTVPYLETKGVDTDMVISNTINESDLRDKYGLVNTSEDESDDYYYSLAKAVQNGLSVSEEYYYFDYEKDQFETIDKDDLLNHTKGTGIYAYEFTVKNESGKTSKSVSRFFVTEDTGGVYKDENYVLFYDFKSFTVTETEIAADVYLDYIDEQANLKVYKVEDNLNIKNAEDEGFIVYDTLQMTNNGRYELTELPLGSYKFGLYFYAWGDEISDGVSTIIPYFGNDFLELIITENPYSYEEDSALTANGETGYIIIPKSIQLSKEESSGTLYGEAEIKFANYVNATGVNYQVSVDETFKMSNSEDPSNEVTVTVSSTDAIAGDSDNILNLGTFSTSYIESGKKITFSTAPITEVNDSKWEGSFTFYFVRK